MKQRLATKFLNRSARAELARYNAEQLGDTRAATRYRLTAFIYWSKWKGMKVKTEIRRLHRQQHQVRNDIKKIIAESENNA